MEKYSDRPKRQALVEKFREKAIAEAEEEIARIKRFYGDDPENFSKLFTSIYALNALKEFIVHQKFLSFEMLDELHDAVVYSVHTNDIRLLLQDDFNVAIAFLGKLSTGYWNIAREIACILGDDIAFANSLISPFERCLFERRQTENVHSDI